MPRPTKDPPTYVLSAAGALLRTLTPSALGMMLVIANNTSDKQTQADIASAVGRSQSTVSDYQRDLTESTPPLAMRHGQHFVLTDAGEEIIDLIDNVAAPLGRDLSSVDWADESDKEALDTLLTPLHDSRTIVPFCVLDSLSERSNVKSPDDSPTAVWIDDLLHDLEIRQADNDEMENISMSQLRRTIRLRFVDTDTAHFDDSKVTLTEKGVRHAWLLGELTQFLQCQKEIEDSSSAAPDRSANDDGSREASEEIDRQDAPRQSRGRVPTRVEADEQPSLVPVYRLRSTEQEDDDPDLILPFTMSVEELIDRAQQLGYEHGPNAQLDLDWMIQTESGLHPVTPETNSPLSSAIIQSESRSK